MNVKGSKINKITKILKSSSVIVTRHEYLKEYKSC